MHFTLLGLHSHGLSLYFLDCLQYLPISFTSLASTLITSSPCYCRYTLFKHSSLHASWTLFAFPLFAFLGLRLQYLHISCTSIASHILYFARIILSCIVPFCPYFLDLSHHILKPPLPLLVALVLYLECNITCELYSCAKRGIRLVSCQLWRCVSHCAAHRLELVNNVRVPRIRIPLSSACCPLLHRIRQCILPNSSLHDLGLAQGALIAVHAVNLLHLGECGSVASLTLSSEPAHVWTFGSPSPRLLRVTWPLFPPFVRFLSTCTTSFSVAGISVRFLVIQQASLDTLPLPSEHRHHRRLAINSNGPF